MNTIRAFFCFGAAATLLTPAFAIARTQAAAGAGPVPQALVTAKTIFVPNAGSDSGLFPEPFSGDPSRAYSEFYAALKATGACLLVNDPSQADLVLELQLTAPYGPTNPNKAVGAADPLPMFRLVVYDRKTHYILWTFTESIEGAYMQKNHDKNFDEALSAILSQFLEVAGKAPAAAH